MSTAAPRNRGTVIASKAAVFLISRALFSIVSTVSTVSPVRAFGKESSQVVPETRVDCVGSSRSMLETGFAGGRH
jgi:hypothetical protein